MTSPIRVSNADFLAACFGDQWPRAHVCGFDEDPGDLEAQGLSHYWAGGRWAAMRDTARLGRQNAYFTISLFADDPETGKARRRKALFEATHVVVIDDVGTKVRTEDVPVALRDPSWVLETSPGNYQWGYILTQPETDAGRVNALLDGMVASGLAADGKDPGMKGVTRYVRLPEGRNTKAKYGTGAGFICSLVVWAPARRFEMTGLAAEFEIELPAVGAVSGVSGRVKGLAESKDELFGLLDQWGMISGTRAADGEGWLCECPWIDDHTGRADSGSAYWLGGAFLCHHGHCADKGRRDLEKWAHRRVLDESGGLVGLAAWDFPPIRDAAPKPGAGTTPAERFFAELVYVAPEDRFFSLRTGELLTRAAVNFVWGAELAAVGALPVVSPRTGELMEPSRWYADGSNAGRARCADRITYWPGAGVFFEDGGVVMVNRWRAPARLGRVVSDAEVGGWLGLVRHVASRDGAAVADLLLDWMAMVVGSPGEKPGWHVIVQGGQGLGKDMIVQPVKAGVGEANASTVDAKGLSGSFNAWAESRLVVVNELKQNSAGTATGADQYNVLKALTEHTNKTIKINQKNQKEYYARNVSAFYATSNDERAVALEEDDRRFLVVMAGDAKTTPPLPAAEYAVLGRWMEDGGGAALAAEWLWQRWEAMDAGRRGVLRGRAPGTAGKLRMIAANEDVVVGWMREQIEDGVWPDLMTGPDIARALSAAAKSGAGGFSHVPSPHRWGAALRGLGGGKVYGGHQVRLKSGERTRLWATRSEARFEGMGEPQLAQAYISAAGNSFRDDETDSNVTPITRG